MFAKGFEKTAINWSSVGDQAKKALTNKAVLRNAAVGAGTGALAGTATDSDSRVGGALKGGFIGGLTGGLGTAGYKKVKQLSAAKGNKQTSFSGI